MAIKISNLSMPVDKPESDLASLLARRLGVKRDELTSWRILRKSLDARSRRNLKFVYSAIVDLPDEQTRFEKLSDKNGVSWYRPESADFVSTGSEPLPERPVVVGSGPAGLLAAYYLAKHGFRPLVIERGQPVKQRVPAIREFDNGGAHDSENNYLFGEGGAGCFSDGKLTSRMSGPDVDWVLERFVECGGPDSIRYVHRPHLGSNKLPLICRNFRRKIEAMGGEYRFGCRLESLSVNESRINGIATSSGTIPTTQVILAIGHSARDTYRMLHEQGVPMAAKAVQLGLRLEHPQEHVNRHRYASSEYLELLGAVDYTLVARGQKDLYTFCMCAGGIVIPSISQPKMFCTNGMSNSRHDTPFANSGLVVTLEPHEFGSDHPLSGMHLQEQYEGAAYRLCGESYEAPIQTAADFLNGRVTPSSDSPPSSYQRGTHVADLSAVIPPTILQAIRAGLPIMDRKLKGDFLRDATLVGPEMRGSAPVRIDREHHTRQSPTLSGLYPVG